LKYNFDEEEFNKGDAEFRKQFQANLQKEYAPTDTQNLVIKNFYFSRDTDKLTPNNPHFSSNPNLKLRTEPALSPQISPMAKHQSFQMQPPSSKVFQKPGS
jgi:serum/glucocorticoid-regulated kinase 2